MNREVFARGFLKGLPDSSPVEAYVLQEGENFIRFVNMEHLGAHRITRDRGVVYAGKESIAVGTCFEAKGVLMLPASVLTKLVEHPQGHDLTTPSFWECLTSFKHPNSWVNSSTLFWIRHFLAEKTRPEGWWKMDEFLIPLVLRYKLMTEIKNSEERAEWIRELILNMNPDEDPFVFGQLSILLRKSHSAEDFEEKRLNELKNSAAYSLEVSK